MDILGSPKTVSCDELNFHSLQNANLDLDERTELLKDGEDVEMSVIDGRGRFDSNSITSNTQTLKATPSLDGSPCDHFGPELSREDSGLTTSLATTATVETPTSVDMDTSLRLSTPDQDDTRSSEDATGVRNSTKDIGQLPYQTNDFHNQKNSHKDSEPLLSTEGSAISIRQHPNEMETVLGQNTQENMTAFSGSNDCSVPLEDFSEAVVTQKAHAPEGSASLNNGQVGIAIDDGGINRVGEGDASGEKDVLAEINGDVQDLELDKEVASQRQKST